MNDLQHILGQFHQGLLDSRRLREAVERLARQDAATESALRAALAAEYRVGRLPPEIYAGLDALWADADAGTVAASLSGAARVLSPSVGGDPTLALPLAEATEVYNPPTRAASPSGAVGALRPLAGGDPTLAPPLAEATEVYDPPPDRDPTWVIPPADATLALNPPTGDTPTLAIPAAEATAVFGTPPRAPHPRPAPVAEATAPTFGTQAATRAQAHQLPHADRPLQIGMVLKERFVLEAVIGGGGMGTVFKALDLRKSEARDREPYVALKVLNPEFRDNPTALIALQRETKRAQTLSHPNIINVFDFDRDGNHVFMSMECLAGRPLNQVIRELPETGMPFHKAWPLIRAMAEALGYAHRKDVVHSDFKPGNVFLDQGGEVRILDFGIACAAGRAGSEAAEHTIFNARDLGALTPAYASLEMIQQKEPDPRDDLYALGCVAYELLAGKHPYGKLAADKALELGLQPKPIPGLNRKQWRGLQRALALKREDRVPSAEDFIGDLQGRSPAFYALWGLALAALAGSGAGVYFGVFAPPPQVRAAVPLTAEQQVQIKDLLELAAVHFEVGYLTAPTGSNALWAYQEALKIDPYSADAIKGLHRIADALEQAAWQAFERGDTAESLKKVVEGLEAVPDHPGLKALRAKLER